MTRRVICLCCWLLPTFVRSLSDGLLPTPAMGYNPWNAFHNQFGEKEAKEILDVLVSSGLAEAGYIFFNLDDGWMASPREASRALTANQTLFPTGIKGIADYAHQKGLKLGIYSSAGEKTCMNYPASLGFEKQDAKAFAEWTVDLVKYDNCWSSKSEKGIRERYEAMRDAIAESGRAMVLAMCEWGLSQPWLYGAQVGHMWRTSKDISLKIEATWSGILENLDSTARLARFAGPGGWNDADMLEIGPPGNQLLTLSEQRAHFALWALIKSPLIIGADIRILKPAELKILKNTEIIAVNQDPLGVAGDMIAKVGPEEVWAAPLQGGDRAVVLFNRQMPAEGVTSLNMTVHWHQIGYQPHIEVLVRDLYKGKDVGVFTGEVSMVVPCHGVAMLRLTPSKPTLQHERWRPWPCSANPADAAHNAWTCPGAGLQHSSSSRDDLDSGLWSAPSSLGLVAAGASGVLLGIGLGLVIPFRQAWASLRPRHAFTSLRPTGS